MAHRRSFRGRGISDSQRRKKTWTAIKFATTGATSGEAAFLTSFTLETPALSNPNEIGSFTLATITDPTTEAGDELSTLPEEATILRIRGTVLFPKNLAGTPPSSNLEQHVIGFGVTDIRSLVGGSAPNPIIDADWDGWMFLRQSAVTPVDSEGTVFDVKSMRKLRGGDTFFMTVTTSGGSGSIPISTWVVDARLLLLLP